MNAMRNPRYRLSLVVPMYNEADSVQEFLTRALPIVERLTPDFEIICVNDGSNDGTAAALAGAHVREKRVKVVTLTRNFGKELALAAGLDLASGDAVVPIDADLQHPPELIPALVERWQAGFDMVIAVRADRRTDGVLRRLSARAFYRLAGRVAEVAIPPDAGDFRLLDRVVVQALRQLPERTRFLKGMFAWLGFRTASIPYTPGGRTGGASTWRFWKLWNYGLEGLFSFTTAPLRVWTYVGLLFAVVAACYLTFTVIRTLVLGIEVPGYASLIVTLLFFSGLNMVGLGILGEYVGRIFVEVKRRPLYVVQSAVGFDSVPAEREPDRA